MVSATILHRLLSPRPSQRRSHDVTSYDASRRDIYIYIYIITIHYIQKMFTRGTCYVSCAMQNTEHRWLNATNNTISNSLIFCLFRSYFLATHISHAHHTGLFSGQNCLLFVNVCAFFENAWLYLSVQSDIPLLTRHQWYFDTTLGGG